MDAYIRTHEKDVRIAWYSKACRACAAETGMGDRQKAGMLYIVYNHHSWSSATGRMDVSCTTLEAAHQLYDTFV